MTRLPPLRHTYFGSGPVLVAALLTFAVLKAVWPALSLIPQHYPDPVVGALTFDAASKWPDFLAMGLFVSGGLLLGGVLSLVCHAAAPGGPASDEGVAVNQLLLLSLVPAGWRLAVSAFSASPYPTPPVATVALIALLAVLAVALLARFRTAPTAAEITGVVGGVVLAPLLAGFAGLGVVTLVCRAFPHAGPHLQNKGHLLAESAIGLAVVAAVVLRFVSDTPATFHRRALRAMVVAQVGVPLLWFVAVPSALFDPHDKFHAHYPGRLVATVAVIAAFSVWRIVRRWWADPTLTRILAPAAVAALAVFVHVDNLGLPSADSGLFHWGEEVLPWQQWIDFHSRPYTDFVPIHGLMNYLRGAFAGFYFDGTAGDFAPASVLLVAVAAAATAVAAGWLVSPVGALFVLMVALPYSDRLYFTAPALFLIAAPALLRRPAVWLVVWIAASALLVAYNAALGPAFAAGTLPAAVWGAYRLVKAKQWPALAGIVVAVLAAGGGGYAVVPVRRTVVGFVDFVVQNQWTNNVGNGIAWSTGYGHRDLTTGLGTSQFSWELFRFSWIAVALAGGFVAWRELCRPTGQRRVSLAIVGFGTLAVLLASSPWVMGRIDAGFLSRPGAMSQLAISLLVPPLVLLGTNRARVGRDLLTVAVAVGFTYPFAQTRLDPAALQSKAETFRVVADSVTVVDGAQLHMPRLGRVVKPDPDFLDPIARFRTVLDDYLKPGETYLDFTNGSARYYYLGMRCPVRYVPYVACNAKLQAGMLDQLNADPVHAVMVLPAEQYDGVPDSFRSYDLYRAYVLKFVPVQRQEFLLLVDPARVPDAGPIGSEPQLKLLDAAFCRADLQRIPVAWGRSWSTLRGRFDPVASVAVDHPASANAVLPDADGYRPAGDAPSVQWPIPAAVTDGTAADYVRLRFDDVPADAKATAAAMHNEPADPATSAEPMLALRWVHADGTPSQPVTFFARPGDLLVPLGSYPRWLLGRRPSAIRLDVVNPKSIKRFRFSEVEFLQLKPVG